MAKKRKAPAHRAVRQTAVGVQVELTIYSARYMPRARAFIPTARTLNMTKARLSEMTFIKKLPAKN
ncbi:MAG: hypothetical protein ACR2LC_18025 [Pyrinomonadaceae bacterium]